jgi:type III secretory pathway component EscS
VIAASILCWIPTGIALWVLVMWIGWPALLAAVVGVYFTVALIGIVKANT